MCQGFEILFKSAGDSEFFAAFDAEDVLAGCPGINLFDKVGIDQDGAMNTDEAVGLEFLGDGGDGFAEQIGAGEALKQNIVALSFDEGNVRGINEENAFFCFNRELGGFCDEVFKLWKKVHESREAI